MALRVPLRPALRHVGQATSRRAFTTAGPSLEAHNFTMPAMSPTMTEGNISSWKVKEGDSFSTGDILLDIETDKATMDIEAQDDGIVAKIIQAEGSKGISVGSRIAVLADPGDDLKSLEIPPEEPAKPATKSKDQDRSAHKKNSSSKTHQSDTDTSISESSESSSRAVSTASPSKAAASGSGQNSKYPLYPAVAALIHENHIPESEISQIPATGPNSRLLKGDVLAYLGRIGSGYSSSQSKRIQKLSHLDFSHIKKQVVTSEKEEAKSTESIRASGKSSSAQPTQLDQPPAPSKTTTISLPISLAEVFKVQRRVSKVLNTSLPLSEFVIRAVSRANKRLPPKPQPSSATPSPDELFNAVLGLGHPSPKTSTGTYLPQVVAPPEVSHRNSDPSGGLSSSATATSTSKRDIIDILTGSNSNSKNNSNISSRSWPHHHHPSSSSSSSSLSSTSSASPSNQPNVNTANTFINNFTLTVPVEEEKRARIFLERVKTGLQDEPGRLVF